MNILLKQESHMRFYLRERDTELSRLTHLFDINWFYAERFCQKALLEGNTKAVGFTCPSPSFSYPLSINISLLFIYMQWNVSKNNNWRKGPTDNRTGGWSLPFIINQRDRSRSPPRNWAHPGPSIIFPNHSMHIHTVIIHPSFTSTASCQKKKWKRVPKVAKCFRWDPNNAWHENANLPGLMEFCGKLFGNGS